MTEAEYLDEQINQAKTNEKKAQERGDTMMVLFYRNAAIGFQIKRNCLTIAQISRPHNAIK